MRADLVMVERGLAPSRNRARELIENGCVFIQLEAKGRRLVSKASQKLTLEEAAGLVVDDPSGHTSRFVSRGGLKLQGALDRVREKFNWNVVGARALDVGLSTGGFSDCLLQAGADSIVGLDVGHDQLAAKLRAEPRLKALEGINARDLSSVQLIELNAGHKFDVAVIDVSFISLSLVLPAVIQYLQPEGRLLALVKPQFEVGRAGLGKNGIVKNTSLYAEVEEKIRTACAALNLKVEDYFESSIEGSDGNREFFVFARFA